jgi:HSP20 family protein
LAVIEGHCSLKKKGDVPMAEAKVKMEVNKETEGLVRWPGFEMPLFRGSLFGMNPFALMKRFTEEMDRSFLTKVSPEETGFWSPAVEVKELDGKFLVSAELPGLKKDEVKVEVADGNLVLEGERKQEKEEKREGYYHSERSYGHFYRSLPLPEGAQLDKASAEFANGVLEVSVPVPNTENKRREIPVHEGGKTKTAGG